jgi:ABC-type antimicrobial peptide transport system permease subunit
LLCAARMRPGVRLEQAKAALKLSAEEFRRKFPGPLMDPQESATAVPLRDLVVSDVRTALLILLGAVGFVLLIACANVANRLLARATLRKREIAIRAALGAERGRIVFQLLTESVLLALIGSVLGLGLGYAGVRALLAASPANIPRIGEHGSAVVLDWRVLAFTLLVALFTGIATGGLPVAHIRTMEQVLGESTARGDFNTMLLSIFAGVALLLAAIGIYGLMAYSVQQRTQEIGIRMALGASPENVRKMVVSQGMRLAAIGVVIGVAAALGLTRFMAGLIYDVKTWDPAVFVTVAVPLSTVSWFATYFPARRASRVDPTVSLRYE